MARSMNKKQNYILRCTINVDPDNEIEHVFLRAMLTRLNVLSAKIKPKEALDRILQGKKLRQHFEQTQRAGETTKVKGTVVTVEPLPLPQPTPKTTSWGKSKLAVVRIKEASMSLAGLGAQHDRDRGAEKNSDERNFLLDSGEFL